MTPARVRDEWEINGHLLNPWIHPEDARKAIHAHLHESRKNRDERVSGQIIVEDLFIASLVNISMQSP
jgi:hypothetical protein